MTIKKIACYLPRSRSSTSILCEVTTKFNEWDVIKC